MMIAELEAVALRLFAEHGFDAVTVEEIASAARISVRTFYRYFTAKEDVLQVKIDRHSEALRTALANRPTDEPPLHSLRLALTHTVSQEDTNLARQWTAVVAATPSALKAVLGGIQLKVQRVIAEFLATRLDLPPNALVPTMLAAAVGGVVQAARTQWFIEGGDLATRISSGLEILERGIGSDPRTWDSP